MVAAFGADGTRLRDAPRDPVRPRRGRLVGLVRAPLQRRPRQRLRQPRQPHRDDGQPLPRRRAPGAPRRRRLPTGRRLARDAGAIPGAARGLPAARRARGAVGVRRQRQQDGRRRAAVDAQQGGPGGRRRGRGPAARRAGRPRGGVPARRPRGRAVHAVDGAARARAAGHRLRLRVRRQRRTADPRRPRLGRRDRAPGRSSTRRRRCSRASRARLPSPSRPDRASRRFPRPRQRGPLRRRRRARPRGGPDRRRRADPGAGLEPCARPSVPSRSADRYPWLDAAAGVHPHDAAKATDADWAAIEAWSRDERVVAIGETGLDSDRMFSPWDAQLENLRRNLALALETGKPAILHCRSKAGAARRAGRAARRAAIGRVRRRGRGAGRSAERPPAVIHSFSGPVDYARDVLAMGLAVSFSGLVFRRGRGGVGRGRLARAGRPAARRDRRPVPDPAAAPRARATSRRSWH